MFPSGLVSVVHLVVYSRLKASRWQGEGLSCYHTLPRARPRAQHTRGKRKMCSVDDIPMKWLILGSLHPWHSIILLCVVGPQALWVCIICRALDFWVALEALRILEGGRGLRIHLVKCLHFTTEKIKIQDLKWVLVTGPFVSAWQTCLAVWSILHYQVLLF